MRDEDLSLLMTIRLGDQECSARIQPGRRTREYVEMFAVKALKALKIQLQHQKPGRREAQVRMRCELGERV